MFLAAGRKVKPNFCDSSVRFLSENPCQEWELAITLEMLAGLVA